MNGREKPAKLEYHKLRPKEKAQLEGFCDYVPKMIAYT